MIKGDKVLIQYPLAPEEAAVKMCIGNHKKY